VARPDCQRGFTYLGLLLIVVILGLMLTAVGRVWSFTEQREREIQLLFVGDQFRLAIASYYQHTHSYPQSLQQLLGDPDSTLPRRYLRRLYFDPMTGNPDWDLIPAPGGGVMGVASKSSLAPIKHAGFAPVEANFADASCYCSWQFVFVPRHSYLKSGGPPAAAPDAANN
jgi:type II secretory pathway pseudopilin PulG